MSVTAAELRKLASLNLSPEQMAGVLELLALRAEREEEAMRVVAEKRAADAARKREERAKRRNVQGQSKDSPEDVRRTPSPLVPPFPPAPPNPPIIPPTHSENFSAGALEAKLREAAGWQNEPHPGLFVTGPIEALIANGADLETDVLPVIRGRAKSVRRPSGWNYFVGPIQDAMAARRSAGTGPPPKTVNGAKTEPAKSFEELAKELVPGWKPGTKFVSSTG